MTNETNESTGYSYVLNPAKQKPQNQLNDLLIHTDISDKHTSSV